MEMDRFSVLTAGFSRNSFEYAIRTLREAGIKAVELWGGISHCFPGYENEEQLREAEEILKKYGTKAAAFYPEQVSYPYNLACGEPGVRKRTEDYYDRCMDFCVRMKIPAMVLHPGYMLYDQSPKAAFGYGTKALGRLAAKAEGMGIVPLLLHGGANYVSGCKGTAEILGAANHPALQVELDLSQLLVDGETAETAFFMFGSRIRQVRMADGPGEHLALGDGSLALREGYTGLMERGYTGPVVLQFDSRRYVTDAKRALITCVRELETW